MLTTDGTAQLLNGRLDWGDEEEIYGRGTTRAFWWSPDSSWIAFLQLDERPVPEFALVDHLPYRQKLEAFDYPKPGDPNPLVRLGVVPIAGGAVKWVDTTKYANREHLIVRVSWHPDGRQVVYQVQDREQTWLDLDVGDSSDRHDTDPAARDDKGVGRAAGRPVMAEGRRFRVVQRA